MRRVEARARTSATNGRGRETLVLCAGVLSAAALVWAATATLGSARASGEVAVAKLAGESADAVLLEWERRMREPRLPAEWMLDADAGLHWTAGEDVALARPRELSAEEAPAAPVFDALFAEARQLELGEGDPREALAALGDALGDGAAALALDPERAARGLLRRIQLAARLGEDALVTDTLLAMRQRFTPRDALDGTSVLLVGLLAAGEAADAGTRTRLAAELARAWSEGELALPAPRATLADGMLRSAPVADALRARLASLTTDEAARRHLARGARRERLEALHAAHGALPLPAWRGRWILETTDFGTLASRTDGVEVDAAFVRVASLVDGLGRDAGLPSGFHLDFDGTATDAGPVLRERTPLSGSPLGFVLRHADPARLYAEEHERVRTLRIALFALALATLVASGFTARALARERRLAALKSAFVAGVSHDLRTPLASILFLAENLEAGRVAGEPAKERYYTSIRRAADRLRRLVDDVLDFARLERGDRIAAALEEHALGPWLDDLEEELAPFADEGGIALTFTRGALPAAATFDGPALRRAVWNLVENARRHSGSEAVRVHVEAPPGRELLVLHVSDDGCGVPERRRATIFQPYERGERGDLAQDGGGAGLGLAIVRAVAEAHGGAARVASGANGVGARFELELDLAHTRRAAGEAGA